MFNFDKKQFFRTALKAWIKKGLNPHLFMYYIFILGLFVSIMVVDRINYLLDLIIEQGERRFNGF